MRIIPTLRGFLVGAGVSGIIMSTPASSSAQTVGNVETTYSVRRALERLPYYACSIT